MPPLKFSGRHSLFTIYDSRFKAFLLSFRRFPHLSSDLVLIRPTLTKEEARTSLRWKLLVLTSISAAVVGAGGVITLAYFWDQSTMADTRSNLLLPASLIIIIVPTTIASIFVYRHTARRRKLQTIITAFLTLVLIISLVLASEPFLVA
jgi:integral membrane sensor domain MASE1